MWAKIITIKEPKALNYFSLCALKLFNTVSQFEVNYWNELSHDILIYWDASIYIYIYIYIYVYMCMYVSVWVHINLCLGATQHNDWATVRSCSHLSLQPSMKHLPHASFHFWSTPRCVCLLYVRMYFVSLLKAVALIEAHRAIRALHLVQLKSMICLLSWLSFTSCCSHIQIQCTVPLSRPDTVKTLLCETLKHLKGYSTPKWKCCRSKSVKLRSSLQHNLRYFGIKTRRLVTVPLTAK